MVDIDKAIIARLKKEGKDFEILVDCDRALEFKSGKINSLDEVLATKDIYSDVKKGIKVPEQQLQTIFHTTDTNEIATSIIKKGDIQLTTEHRTKLREQKKKQIINFIQRNAIDAKTGFPHPPQRIEKAMEECKCKIDEFKSADMQVQEIVNRIRELIPIRFEVREIEIIVPAIYTGKGYGAIKNLGKMLKEDWLNNGSLRVVLEIPAGMQADLEDELNKLTKGEVEIKILKKK